MGPLPARYGVITRREQIQEVDQTLTTTTKNPLHLNDAIVAAYQQMTKTYAPNYSNAVIVLTAGIDAPGDMSVSALLARLHGLFSSDRPVEIVILQFGQAGNFHAMQQIASATDGAAYQILSPKQVGKVFIQAIARRI
jgi:Ca-activated chloride channel family protein